MSIPIAKNYIKNFEKMGFGMFVHWGLYSQLGKGEWTYFVENMDMKEYSKLINTFTAKDFNAEELEEERLYYHLDDWQKYTCKDLNLRTATYLKYVNPSSISMGIGD